MVGVPHRPLLPSLPTLAPRVRTRSWTSPPRGKRAPRVGISSAVFGVRDVPAGFAQRRGWGGWGSFSAAETSTSTNSRGWCEEGKPQRFGASRPGFATFRAARPPTAAVSRGTSVDRCGFRAARPPREERAVRLTSTNYRGWCEHGLSLKWYRGTSLIRNRPPPRTTVGP